VLREAARVVQPRGASLAATALEAPTGYPCRREAMPSNSCAGGISKPAAVFATVRTPGSRSPRSMRPMSVMWSSANSGGLAPGLTAICPNSAPRTDAVGKPTKSFVPRPTPGRRARTAPFA
jgi:hypothetical protein